VIIDEAAKAPNLGVQWRQAIRPTLADLQGDAWMMSTPRGYNDFHTFYQRGMDSRYPTWQSFQSPTSANPYIKASEIRDMQVEMTERDFRQEVEAAFLDGGGQVFRFVSERSILQPSAPEQRHQYVIGVDWGRVDYTVMSVLDISSWPIKQVHLERSNQVSYAQQRGRLAGLCATWRPLTVLAESNSIGEPVISQLQSDGFPVESFYTTQQTKAKLVDGLALALERGRIELLDDKEQRGELSAYEGTLLPGGGWRYAAPGSLHDDTVMALMLAVRAAGEDYTGPRQEAAIDALVIVQRSSEAEDLCGLPQFAASGELQPLALRRRMGGAKYADDL
jgi:hypothetical protein